MCGRSSATGSDAPTGSSAADLVHLGVVVKKLFVIAVLIIPSIAAISLENARDDGALSPWFPVPIRGASAAGESEARGGDSVWALAGDGLAEIERLSSPPEPADPVASSRESRVAQDADAEPGDLAEVAAAATPRPALRTPGAAAAATRAPAFPAIGAALIAALSSEPEAAAAEPPEPADTSVETEPRFGSDKLLLLSLSGRTTASYPRASGEITPELEYNGHFAATNPDNERGNWLGNIHLGQVIHFHPRFRVDSNVRVVLESNGEDQRFYSDFPHEGVYITELVARLDLGPVDVFAGKYEPAKGIRGHGAIFFGNYSRNLDLDGRLGGGASLTLGGPSTGAHTLAAHLFRVDRSRLRGEIISDRWRDDEHLAAAGEIGAPRSFLLTLHGTTVDSDVQLAYTLGGGVQRRGDLPDEDILLASLFARFPIASAGQLELSADALVLDDAGGYRENKWVAGPSIGWGSGSYWVGATYTWRRVLETMSGDVRFDHIGELVGRYYLSRRITVEGAYQRVRERGQTENALGAVIRYTADWLIH